MAANAPLLRRAVPAAVLALALLGGWGAAQAGDDPAAPVPAEPAPAEPTPAAPPTPEPAAPGGAAPDAAAGLRHLLETPYLPSALDQDLFDNLWRSWPEAQRVEAEAATPAERRLLAFARYGLTPRPDQPDGPPLQFVVTDKGAWHLNCFACHGGEVAGQVIPGLPNTNLALQTYVEDVLRTKRLLKRPLQPEDFASLVIPFGENVGTTNAVVFSVSLLQWRDRHLNVVTPKGPPRLPHHDLDAPPWWHYKRRTNLYLDGFAKRNHRALMQFVLVPTTSRETVLSFEDDFRDIEAWIETVQAPKYPFAIDATLAAEGETVFAEACAGCHGTYGSFDLYPNRLVPIEVVGTDRARLDAITPEQRAIYADSWLTKYDPEGVLTDPGGYIAPPLDGIWATAPYLHNGSVPTLWHLLHPPERPAVWRRASKDYDQARGGLRIETAAKVPVTSNGDARRRWFDTAKHGKSAAGHDFPSRLSLEARRALLAYLKTL